MRGDVWVKENSNGEKVVCIDNGKFVSETVIKVPPAKNKIKEVNKINEEKKRIKKGEKKRKLVTMR